MEKIIPNVYLNNSNESNNMETNTPLLRKPLSTKKAVELLLNGTLKKNVCRYCLDVTSPLFELDQIMQFGGQGVLYKVTIRNMIAHFYPFKVADDPNLPNKICNKCLNRTITSYLFTQQCERAERALRNCFDDINEKIDKLDPLEQRKKRGRQKLNPNYNVIYSEHKNVIDYAEPVINIINSGSVLINDDLKINPFECPKCWQVLPSMESLLNHEKIHPKSMWCHCRYCGKSFPKRTHMKKHIQYVHVSTEENTTPRTGNDFRCNDCGIANENYIQHLQHIEKHKFKMVLQHLVERKMDKLCSVCLNKDTNMVELNKIVCLHGGYPESTGDRSLYNILASTLPDMNSMHSYTGTKICEKCLNHAISSYIFVNQIRYIRNRLDNYISVMINNLNKIVEPKENIFIEIAENTILPAIEEDNIDLELLLGDNEDIDESKLKVDVLEDEFRTKSESESESDEETRQDVKTKPCVVDDNVGTNFKRKVISPILPNPAKKAIKTYSRRLMNGYQSKFAANNKVNRNSLDDICSEFLTFKKKRKPVRRLYKYKFTCPLCSKGFVSDYYLKRHILKHVNKKVICKLCGCAYKSKFFLHEHVKMVHLLKKTSYSSCKVCGRTFTDPSKMKSHEKSHATKQCQLCDKSFVSQKHHDSHMQRHAFKFNVIKTKKAQTCSFCETECSDDNKLSLHVNKVHLQIKPYSCDMCDKLFYTESNMMKHKTVHSLFSKETCEFCNKQLKSRKDLVIHIRKHIEVKPHQCQICGQSFYSELNLQYHMKKHHGGRYYCKFCKITYTNKSELKAHINVAHNIF